MCRKAPQSIDNFHIRHEKRIQYWYLTNVNMCLKFKNSIFSILCNRKLGKYFRRTISLTILKSMLASLITAKFSEVNLKIKNINTLATIP